MAKKTGKPKPAKRVRKAAPIRKRKTQKKTKRICV